MAVINLIRISPVAGALIADEEQWNQIRRLLSFDNLFSLLDAEMAESLNAEAVFGAIGTPSLAYEAVQRIKKKVREFYTSKDGSAKELRTIEGITRIAVKELRTLIRERVDQKLSFCFGFTSDDLNRGYFESGGSKVEIKQELIVKEAQALATLASSSGLIKPVLDLTVLLAGYDREKGFTWNVFSAEDGSVYVGTGTFESLGKGSDVSTLNLIAYAGRKQLSERRDRLDRMEAIVELIKSFNAAARLNHEVGGYPQLILIDGEAPDHAGRFREVVGHRTKLACEIIASLEQGFIAQEAAYPLVEALIWGDIEDLEAEKSLFEQATDAFALEHYLRGYKLDSLPRRKKK